MDFPVKYADTKTNLPFLQHISDPPKSLTYRGTLPAPELKLLTVVGARKYTTYGQQVVNYLIDGLAGYPVGIVSGLALGIDALAHEAALRNNLYTLAIPGSGIDDSVIYPRRHRPLAQRILSSGGGLLSEFEPTFTATKWSFAKRNRIMAALSHATLIVEASEKSGTLITARLAVDYNRDLLVVPGNIFSSTAAGPHQFLKLGAFPITQASDILHLLGIDPNARETNKTLFGSIPEISEDEQHIIRLLTEPIDKDSLIRLSKLPAATASALLMEMEIKGLIAMEQGFVRAVV